jgi:2'-5' RNA ligase
MPDLRWTRSEQRHVTVKFFGAVPDADALAEFVADSVRARAPFTLSLGGGGAFPSPRRASVLWIGVKQGTGALGELAAPFATADTPDADTPDADTPDRGRPFRAHLTLARSNRARDLRAVVHALDACGESEPWTVDEVVLFESTSAPSGAVHTAHARFRLAG